MCGASTRRMREEYISPDDPPEVAAFDKWMKTLHLQAWRGEARVRIR